MSIKIYEGYRIKNLTQKQMFEFINDLKTLIIEQYEEHLRELYVRLCASLYETMLVDNHNKKEYTHLFKETKNEKYETKLKELEEKFEKQCRFLYNAHYLHLCNHMDSIMYNRPNNKSLEEMKKELSSNYFGSISELVQTYIENRCKQVEVGIKRDDTYDLETSISLFEPKHFNESKLLFIAHGPLLQSILDRAFRFDRAKQKKENEIDELLEILENETKHKDIYENLISKYELERYFYYSSSEPSSNITEEEWTRRKEDWSKALEKSTIPGLSGMNIHLMNIEMFFNSTSGFEVFKNEDVLNTYFQKYVSIDTRIVENAKKKAKDNYIIENISKDATPSEIMDKALEWNDLYKNNNEEIVRKVKELEETYKTVLKPINFKVCRETILIKVIED